MTFLADERSGTLDCDGAQLRWYEGGGGGGRAVVLLHGSGGSAKSSYWALFPMLAMRRRVIAFDFVDASSPEAPGDPAPYVTQALAVIGELARDEPVDLVGYSFGAVIAAALAATHQELVANLVLVAGWITTDAHQRLRNEIWQQLHDTHHPALAPFMVYTAYSSGFLAQRSDDELAALVATARESAERAAKMRFNRAVDLSGEVGAIEAETLVVGCTEDQMVPLRHSRLLFGGIARARYAEIPSGHGVNLERPAELFTLIDAFLSDPLGSVPGEVLATGHA